MTGNTETDWWIALASMLFAVVMFGFALKQYIGFIIDMRTMALESEITRLKDELQRKNSSLYGR